MLETAPAIEEQEEACVEWPSGHRIWERRSGGVLDVKEKQRIKKVSQFEAFGLGTCTLHR